MTITARLFDAHLRCRTKCYLLSRNGVGTVPEYARWQTARQESYRKSALPTLTNLVTHGEKSTDILGISSLPDADGEVATGVVARTSSMESCLQAVETVPVKGGSGKQKIRPVLFCRSNKLGRTEKLMAVFDAVVLSDMLGRRFSGAKIIYGEAHSETVVSSPAMAEEVRKRTATIATLIAAPSPPDLILNRHCSECEFQTQCRQRAVEKDDLSLLSSMSEKERKKFNERGIFTVTQLSHTFRPRRRRKQREPKPEKYQHALKALAIREGKIHIFGRLELQLDGTPVFFDVEGSPDEDFYYLIGVRVQTAPDVVIQKSFWAEGRSDEERIWKEFLTFLKAVENPILMHYGSYDATFLKRMCAKHGLPPRAPIPVAKAVQRSRNVLSALLGQVYFPTLSNGLKHVAGFLGASWRSPDATGLNSIMWRTQWEATQSEELKNRLAEYNQDDCAALHILVTELRSLAGRPQSREDIEFADDLKKSGTERGTGIHRTLEGLLKSAHSDYSEKKIKLGDSIDDCQQRKKSRNRPRKHKLPSGKGRLISVPRKRMCPNHTGLLLFPNKSKASRRVIDLVFTKSGLPNRVAKKRFFTMSG